MQFQVLSLASTALNIASRGHSSWDIKCNKSVLDKPSMSKSGFLPTHTVTSWLLRWRLHVPTEWLCEVKITEEQINYLRSHVLCIVLKVASSSNQYGIDIVDWWKHCHWLRPTWNLRRESSSDSSRTLLTHAPWWTLEVMGYWRLELWRCSFSNWCQCKMTVTVTIRAILRPGPTI